MLWIPREEKRLDSLGLGLGASVGVETLAGSSFLHAYLSRSALWLQTGFRNVWYIWQTVASTGPRLTRDGSSLPYLDHWNYT